MKPALTASSPVSISVSGVVHFLSACIVFLLGASILSTVLHSLGVRPNAHALLYVDAEANLPTYYSALQLLAAGVLLGAIALVERRKEGQFGLQWLVLSLGFILMSVDETCSLHEKLIQPVRSLLGARELGVFYFAWIIPALIFVGFAGVYFWKFLWHLPPTSRRDFVVAAALFLGGAIGLEMLGGQADEAHGRQGTYLLWTHLEEGLEMFGILYFIRALLHHLTAMDGRFAVVLAADDATSPSRIRPAGTLVSSQ